MLLQIVRLVIAFGLACAGSRVKGVRQHYNEDGAERNVVGEASLLPSGARRTVLAGARI
jgi:hypothetical protein